MSDMFSQKKYVFLFAAVVGSACLAITLFFVLSLPERPLLRKEKEITVPDVGSQNALSLPDDRDDVASGGDDNSDGSPQDAFDAGPLFFATMTHMEGDFTDDVNEDIFTKHVADLRFAMDIADTYGAILTIESEKPFARANTIWGVNIMKEIFDRGHGVGTHCDIGFTSPGLSSVNDFAELFKENKALVDGLVGAENNLGCSGGGSSFDWVLAASQAGFKYIDGVVGMHYLAMDVSQRPSASWTDSYIRSEGFHYNAPFDLVDRMRVVGLANAEDFEEDEDWRIALLAGSTGKIENVSEEASHTQCASRSCPFTEEDVDLFVEQVRDASEIRDTSHIAKLDVYLSMNTLIAKNEDMLHYFFAEMQKLEEEGVIVWASQKDIYEAFVAAQ